MVAASDDVNGDSGSCERVDLTAAAHILDHINFDLLSPDEVKKHACALADRYKLLLEECDNENGLSFILLSSKGFSSLILSLQVEWTMCSIPPPQVHLVANPPTRKHILFLNRSNFTN